MYSSDQSFRPFFGRGHRLGSDEDEEARGPTEAEAAADHFDALGEDPARLEAEEEEKEGQGAPAPQVPPHEVVYVEDDVQAQQAIEDRMYESYSTSQWRLFVPGQPSDSGLSRSTLKLVSYEDLDNETVLKRKKEWLALFSSYGELIEVWMLKSRNSSSGLSEDFLAWCEKALMMMGTLASDMDWVHM